MYGQFGGMQQSMQKLSQEIRVKKLCSSMGLPEKVCEVGNKRKDARYRLGFAGG